MTRRLFTSECVSMGHPDKVADQISDALLDAFLAGDPESRVAVETLVTTGMAMVAGEVTTRAHVDVPDVVRGTVREIGYFRPEYGFDAERCAVLVHLDKQSPDIAQGVDAAQSIHREQGAGDQGMMFGFATRETPELMPLPIQLARRLIDRLVALREGGGIGWLRPDAKSQVTVEYDGDRAVRVPTVVVSTQHDPEVTHEAIRAAVIEEVIRPVIPAELIDAADFTCLVNPTGRFVTGGPQGDCGLTGRKIIVDTYGGWVPHGGGAFSGKDPSKVDRSASYAARWVAKNVVAAGLAERCLVQVAYAIGIAEPVSLLLDTQGTGQISEERLAGLVRDHFSLKPAAIIEALHLKQPIFKATARFGHFGRDGDGYPWERTDRAEALRRAAGL
ncbi:MAG: methionine adenosyltransferase [Planctomycetes bacterium]|nr:methionine adenosyltransferase [Planctomycetota bacterium]